MRGQVIWPSSPAKKDHAPLSAARRKVDEAASQGYDTLRLRHSRRWSEFWEQSYIQIPEDYLENLYYLTLYYLAVSSQGPYPPLFCGGLWTSNRDIRRWDITTTGTNNSNIGGSCSQSSRISGSLLSLSVANAEASRD